MLRQSCKGRVEVSIYGERGRGCYTPTPTVVAIGSRAGCLKPTGDAPFLRTASPWPWRRLAADGVSGAQT